MKHKNTNKKKPYNNKHTTKDSKNPASASTSGKYDPTDNKNRNILPPTTDQVLRSDTEGYIGLKMGKTKQVGR